MWLPEVEGSTPLSILCDLAVPKRHKLFPLKEIGKTFKRWILKVDAFIIFYCLAICKENNKIRIVKNLSVYYAKIVHLKIKAKGLERRKNLYILCVSWMVSQ